MKVLIYISLFFLCACGGKNSTAPSDILSPEKMRDVIVSLNISEALINLNNTALPTEKKVLNFNVFKENNVSKEQYLKSMEFYSQNPKELKKIYAMVLEKMNLMKEEK